MGPNWLLIGGDRRFRLGDLCGEEDGVSDVVAAAVIAALASLASNSGRCSR